MSTTVALVEGEEETSPPGRPKKKAATSGVLAELPPLARERQSSGPGLTQDADCRCDDGSADERAKQPWASVGPHDERSNDQLCPQSETTRAVPAMQTTPGYPAHTVAGRSCVRAPRTDH